MLRRSIKNRAKFDLKKVAPIAVVKECQLPGLFLHGEEDDFISPKHSTELYEVYGGYKVCLFVCLLMRVVECLCLIQGWGCNCV